MDQLRREEKPAKKNLGEKLRKPCPRKKEDMLINGGHSKEEGEPWATQLEEVRICSCSKLLERKQRRIHGNA